MDERYVITFPLFLVASYDPNLDAFTPLSERVGSLISVSLFTEALLAERSRDECAPGGQVWPYRNHDAVYQLTRQLVAHGVTHVTIDPKPGSPAEGTDIPIGDLRKTLRQALVHERDYRGRPED